MTQAQLEAMVGRLVIQIEAQRIELEIRAARIAELELTAKPQEVAP